MEEFHNIKKDNTNKKANISYLETVLMLYNKTIIICFNIVSSTIMQNVIEKLDLYLGTLSC